MLSKHSNMERSQKIFTKNDPNDGGPRIDK